MTLYDQMDEKTREELVEEYGEDEVLAAEKTVRDEKAEEIGKAAGIDPALLKAYASNPDDVNRLAKLIGEDRAAFLISHSQGDTTQPITKTAKKEEAERLQARYPTMAVKVEEGNQEELSEELAKRYPTMVKAKE